MINPNETPETRAAHQHYRFYVRGFKDGVAGVTVKNQAQPDYMRGYSDGNAALCASAKAYAVEVGHDPTYDILR